MTTMEDFLLLQLEQPVKLANGSIAMKDDGTPMTKDEAIAMNLINKAMKGDIQSIQYIENIKRQKVLNTKKR